MDRPHLSRRVSRVSLLLLFAVIVLTLTPATAFAGHILDRFNAPNPAVIDPTWDSYWHPRISGANIACNAQNDDHSVGSWIWTVGAVDMAAWGTFNGATRYDYWGTLVVYQNGDDIYVTDGSGSYNVRVGFAACANPTIYDHRVVWQDYRNGNWDLYGCDLDPVTLAPVNDFAVCVHSGTQSKPDLADGWCVWQDNRSGRYDIYAKDMAGDSIWRVCGNRAAQDSPRTDGNWVVWTDYRNRGYSGDIYGKALPTGRERRICDALKKQWEPVVGGGFVVWTDKRSRRRSRIDEAPPCSIRGYELSSRDAFVVRDHTGSEIHPEIDEHTVIWIWAIDTHMGSPVYADIEGAHLQH